MWIKNKRHVTDSWVCAAVSSFHSLWKLLSCVVPRNLSIRYCTSISKYVNNQWSATISDLLLPAHLSCCEDTDVPFHICRSFTSSDKCSYRTTYPYRLQQLFVVVADVVLMGRFKHWALTGTEVKSLTQQGQQRQLTYVSTLQSTYFFLSSEQSLW